MSTKTDIARTRKHVDTADWAHLAEELDTYGCAFTPRLLTIAQCTEIAGLYDRTDLFRTTVDMARHRFGSGQYRYFTHDLPRPVAELRAALYPHLLTIARDWAARLGRPAPWPDTLEEWVSLCHEAGQNRSAQILLRYEEATGTPCTATCSATCSSPSRWWWVSTRTAPTTPAGSSCSSSSARAPSRAAPRTSSLRATD